MKVYVLGRKDDFNRFTPMGVYKTKNIAEEDVRRMNTLDRYFSIYNIDIREFELNESPSEYAIISMYLDKNADIDKLGFYLESLSCEEILPKRNYQSSHILFSIKYDDYKNLNTIDIALHGHKLAKKIDDSVINALKYIYFDIDPRFSVKNPGTINATSSVIFDTDGYNNAVKMDPSLNTEYNLIEASHALEAKLEFALNDVIANYLNTQIDHERLDRLKQNIICKLHDHGFFGEWDFSKDPSLIPALKRIVKEQ